MLYEDSELREPLEKKYSFATKGTICIFANPPEGKEIKDVEDDMYYAMRVWFMHSDCIPHRKEDITINIEPVKTLDAYTNLAHGGWKGSTSGVKCHVINPFEEMTGRKAQEYYRFLNNAKDGDLVMYPRIMDWQQISWLRYIAGKFYKVNFVK